MAIQLDTVMEDFEQMSIDENEDEIFVGEYKRVQDIRNAKITCDCTKGHFKREIRKYKIIIWTKNLCEDPQYSKSNILFTKFACVEGDKIDIDYELRVFSGIKATNRAIYFKENELDIFYQKMDGNSEFELKVDGSYFALHTNGDQDYYIKKRINNKSYGIYMEGNQMKSFYNYLNMIAC